jgi:hypothetical protein
MKPATITTPQSAWREAHSGEIKIKVQNANCKVQSLKGVRFKVQGQRVTYNQQGVRNKVQGERLKFNLQPDVFCTLH